MAVQIHVILSSAIVGGECSASCTGHFTTGERAARYPLGRRLVAPQSPFKQSGREEVFITLRLEPIPMVVQPVAIIIIIIIIILMNS
jgi:hypothetical protein